MSSPMSPINVKTFAMPDPSQPGVPDVLYLCREDVVKVLDGFSAQHREAIADLQRAGGPNSMPNSTESHNGAAEACDALVQYFKGLKG